MKERPGKYVRDHYGVPAFINRRVRFTGLPRPVTGKITGFRGATLIVKFDADPGTGRRVLLHPTWELEYLPVAGGRWSA